LICAGQIAVVDELVIFRVACLGVFEDVVAVQRGFTRQGSSLPDYRHGGLGGRPLAQSLSGYGPSARQLPVSAEVRRPELAVLEVVEGPLDFLVLFGVFEKFALFYALGQGGFHGPERSGYFSHGHYVVRLGNGESYFFRRMTAAQFHFEPNPVRRKKNGLIQLVNDQKYTGIYRGRKKINPINPV
jgi:hypothetical protein